jgi:hypothetical protein
MENAAANPNEMAVTVTTKSSPRKLNRTLRGVGSWKLIEAVSKPSEETGR